MSDSVLGDQELLQHPPEVIEDGLRFLSALISARAAALLYPRDDQAIEAAIDEVLAASSALVVSSGGFSLQLGASAVLNGIELAFHDEDSFRELSAALRRQGASRVGMRAAPSRRAVERMVALFEAEATPPPDAVAGRVAPWIEPRAVEHQASPESPDRSAAAKRQERAAAVFGALCLTVLEVMERVRRERAGEEVSPPRRHPERLVEEVIEQLGGGSRELLRLAADPVRAGDAAAELAEEVRSAALGASSATLALAIGLVLRVPRPQLVDLGVAALLHAAGRPLGGPARAADLHAIAGRFYGARTGSRSAELRAILVSEQGRPGEGRALHPLSRVLAVASSYARLVTGAARPGVPVAPNEALSRLDGRHDPRIVDLLINLLACWPKGCVVLLDSGEPAVVSEVGGAPGEVVVESTSRPGVRVTVGERRAPGSGAGPEPSGARLVSGTAMFHGSGLEGMRGLPRTTRSGARPQSTSSARPLLAREVVAAPEAIRRVRLPEGVRRPGSGGAHPTSSEPTGVAEEGSDAPIPLSEDALIEVGPEDDDAGGGP